jgi:alanine racemase
MAMVKANAYGHGLVPVARALREADGLAIARLQEAVLLREAGIDQRILLLPTLLDAQSLAICSRQKIDVTAHDEVSLSCIAAQAKVMPLRVWLKLDTGMHRAGLNPEAFVRSACQLRSHLGILELTHMTHFSEAQRIDRASIDRQLSIFHDCRKITGGGTASLANSAALIARPDTHADWVRPGIMLYGDNPHGSRIPLPLRPVMTVKAHVIAIRNIGVGEPVGYGGQWVSARPSRIGTVGIGYGDGYPRHACNGTPVWINGQLVPLVGTVSMDSLTVDLTEHVEVRVGDEAVLWGAELPAVTVAESANTISYELFTSVQQRVNREFHHE